MTFIAGLIAVVTLYLLLQMFRTSNPAVLARLLRTGGGIVILAAAAFTAMRGEIVAAIPLGFFGAALLGWSPLAQAGGGLFGWGGSARPSQLRSAFVELAVDGRTGRLSGVIVAGEAAGRPLDDLPLEALIRLGAAFDRQSQALLESYLDGRFPGWRQHAQSQGAGRSGGGAAASGKMTEQEAYQILGLHPGATRDDIGRAHRSLMKKLHPDQGGSTYLAARVNEAKDTLLQRHRN